MNTYQRAINQLAYWRREADYTELYEPERYRRYYYRFAGGLDILQTVTGKSFAELNNDIVDAMNTRYHGKSDERKGV